MGFAVGYWLISLTKPAQLHSPIETGRGVAFPCIIEQTKLPKAFIFANCICL